jgi:hypothetical protein
VPRGKGFLGTSTGRHGVSILHRVASRARTVPWRSIVTRADPLPPDRLEHALTANRGVAIALALLVFLVGFSVDDLQVFRFPGYLLGIAGAVFFLAAGPLVMSRRFVRKFAAEDHRTFPALAARRRRIGSLTLLLTSLLFIAWLVVFTTGVPPWVR